MRLGARRRHRGPAPGGRERPRARLAREARPSPRAPHRHDEPSDFATSASVSGSRCRLLPRQVEGLRARRTHRRRGERSYGSSTKRPTIEREESPGTYRSRRRAQVASAMHSDNPDAKHVLAYQFAFEHSREPLFVLAAGGSVLERNRAAASPPGRSGSSTSFQAASFGDHGGRSLSSGPLDAGTRTRRDRVRATYDRPRGARRRRAAARRGPRRHRRARARGRAPDPATYRVDRSPHGESCPRLQQPSHPDPEPQRVPGDASASGRPDGRDGPRHSRRRRACSRARTPGRCVSCGASRRA